MNLAAIFSEYETVLLGLSVGSLGLTVASLVALPVVLKMIPGHTLHHLSKGELPPATSTTMGWRLARNLLGWCLILGGLLMLVLPGQGLLTLFLGVLLADFPAKGRLVQRVLRTSIAQRVVASLHRYLGAKAWPEPEEGAEVRTPRSETPHR